MKFHGTIYNFNESNENKKNRARNSSSSALPYSENGSKQEIILNVK